MMISGTHSGLPTGTRTPYSFAVLSLLFFSGIPLFLHHEKLDLVHDFVFALHFFSLLFSSFANLV
jgi:hypothetical protein